MEFEFLQDIVYEKMPLFCDFCNSLGHENEVYRTKKGAQIDTDTGRKMVAQNQEHIGARDENRTNSSDNGAPQPHKEDQLVNTTLIEDEGQETATQNSAQLLHGNVLNAPAQTWREQQEAANSSANMETAIRTVETSSSNLATPAAIANSISSIAEATHSSSKTSTKGNNSVNSDGNNSYTRTSTQPSDPTPFCHLRSKI